MTKDIKAKVMAPAVPRVWANVPCPSYCSAILAYHAVRPTARTKANAFRVDSNSNLVGIKRLQQIAIILNLVFCPRFVHSSLPF